MADNVSLSSAVRANLLALQSTTELIARTQSRLSTGLRVSTAVDDPVSFFQAKALNDRAADFDTRKRGIDQGVSTITAAADAVAAIENLVQQLKGLILTAKSAATNTEVSNLVTQFNDLRSQINNLTTDATYQGLNLVNGTGQTLTVNFSNDTASVLSVNSYDLTVSSNGLDVLKLSATTASSFSAQSIAFQASSDIAAQTLSGAVDLDIIQTGDYSSFFDTVTLTVGDVYRTSSFTLTAGDSINVTLGTQTIELVVASSRTAFGLTGSNQAYVTAGTYVNGTSITFGVLTAATVSAGQTLSGIVNLNSEASAGDYSSQVDSFTLRFGTISDGQSLSAGETIDFTLGTQTVTLIVVSSRTGLANSAANNAYVTAGVYAVGTSISFGVFTSTTYTSTGISYAVSEILGAGVGSIRISGASVVNADTYTFSELFAAGHGAIRLTGGSVTFSAYTGVEARKVVGVGFTTEFNSRINNLDAALTTLRSRAQNLGSNVALLQTRLNFTKSYVNTLSTGAGKLTLADLNEEGANLLALQTRQQLGIQSLAFAGQAEQTILTLFR